MSLVSRAHPYVVGVDTHARTHTLAIVSAVTGESLDCEQFPATAAGMDRALDWVGRRTGGDLSVLWAIEGIGTYGAKLARVVADVGYSIAEAPRMNARSRRGLGKSDPLDAHEIAKATLALRVDALRRPRQDSGVRAALRVLLTARDQMTVERTANVNALTALLRSMNLGMDARKPLSLTQIKEIARWRARTEELAVRVARAEAVRLAKRILEVAAALTENQAQLTELVSSSEAAPLLDETGIGPVTAAVVFTTWSHAGRVRSEAAFAALAGVSPIPASSGNTTRHRLNRGGDRRLNRALHQATLVRMTYDPRTRGYTERRLAEGKTRREIRRSLKRYLARYVYRVLNAAPIPTLATT